jgi:hypothetical protein
MDLYFVEGTIINAAAMTAEIFEKHKAYSTIQMEAGRILISGLKKDQSGSVFLMRFETPEMLQEYLDHEPFYLNGIQTYRVFPFDVHYVNDLLGGTTLLSQLSK